MQLNILRSLNSGQIGASSDRNPDTDDAFFARVNLTFNNIFLNASLRREGSTKLGSENRYGTFPAIGVGADLNSFLDLNGVQQLKARVSYGVTGNLPAGVGLAHRSEDGLGVEEALLVVQLIS